MTGTAMTEAGEFLDIYKLEVVEIPTNVQVARIDSDDEIYRTSAERDRAVVRLIKASHAKNQPLLVGTVSIDKSEAFSALLKKEKIPHQVLNARYHEQEAQIIAQAGRPGAVTIATNMAGRGTDIMLGGNPDMLVAQAGEGADEAAIRAKVASDKQIVIAAGGLFIVGTERHESRRIDNQLRGRAGRQGDPRRQQILPLAAGRPDAHLRLRAHRLGADAPGPAGGRSHFHPWMNKAIERAQTKVEQRNYEIRKTLLKFDDVMNDQRKVIYEQRLELMDAQEVHATIEGMREDVNRHLVSLYIPAGAYAEALGPRHAAKRGLPHLRAGAARGRMGQGRRHRRRGDPPPPAGRDRQVIPRKSR